MASLTQQRCFNHAVREAAARCPQCTRFFCRECITEHGGRVLCATCVRELTGQEKGRGASWVWIGRSIQVMAGLIVAWLFFFWLGLILLSIDSSFHDGSIWKGHWLLE